MQVRNVPVRKTMKIISGILALMLIVAMVGCSAPAEEAPAPTENKTETPAGHSPDDGHGH